MVIDCTRKEFLEAVSLAAAPASGRSPLPLLKNVLVEANDNQLRLVGCDGEMWVERKLATSVSNAGALAIDAKLLQDILGSLPDGEVHLEQPNGSSVRLSQGHSDYRVVGVAAEDFPTIPSVNATAQITMKAADFVRMVDSVSYAVTSENQGRQVLSGVLFDYNGETLRTVATDTHRLAVRSESFPALGSSVSAIVPGRALSVIRRLPVAEDGEITLTFGEDRLVVESEDARVVVQLIRGQFPPFERVIPPSHSKRWMVDREALSGCLRRCGVMARDSSMRIFMQSNGDIITLSARSEGIGEVKEELPVAREGDNTEIAFNGKYMLDAISPITSEGVVIEMTEPDRAAVVKPNDDDTGYLCVIMPMALG